MLVHLTNGVYSVRPVVRGFGRPLKRFQSLTVCEGGILGGSFDVSHPKTLSNQACRREEIEDDCGRPKCRNE